MPYFTKIDSFSTYEGHGSDFHYDYNANSGGGQAFLGGSYMDAEGSSRTSKDLEGMTASFVFRYHDAEGLEHLVNLGAEQSAQFDIAPRGAGSQNMKLALEKKTRPSLLLPALLMLPRTCGRNMADSLNRSPLTLDNYWLRSMWLDVEVVDDSTVYFIPKDLVFEGGSSKKKGVSDGKTVIGEPRFYSLDYERRANDILRIADYASDFPGDIAGIIHFFRRLLLGDDAYSYETCDNQVQKLMSLAALHWPELYSGISDPLPVLMKVINCPEDAPSAETRRRAILEPRNFIFFGAPGTGKSHELNEIAEDSFPEANVTRVTFCPDYTYSQFVGCFKPMTKDAEDGKTEITYQYVPGPFLSTYIEATTHPEQDYLLIVEEINRANPAAVFGDVFQLLDRDPDGRSEYSVAAPIEMQKTLVASGIDSDKLALPSNMYIWATMNSADQGVFPMDTAFKRRWDFRYMGINEGEDAGIDGTPLNEIEVPCGKRLVKWNNLRRAINEFMSNDELKINEDKLLGPFFVNPKALTDERFASVFKDKVLLYLFEDAGKTKRTKMFRKELKTYSQICEAFDEKGEWIFGSGFDDHIVFPDEETDADDSSESQE